MTQSGASEMNWKLLVLCCGLSCLGLRGAAGLTPPNSMEALLVVVREEKVDPYQVSVAASELAKLYPQSHPQFLDLFRHAQVLRNKRWLFKLMNDLSALAGQPIRIKFRLTNGQLYSFQFRDGP